MIRLQAVMNFHNYSFFVSRPVGLIINKKTIKEEPTKNLAHGLAYF